MSANDLPQHLPLSLGPGRVDVWLMSPDSLDERRRQACLDLLDDDERARHDRYRAPSAQRQFLVARAVLRTVLSCYAPLRPADWRFDANGHGKPRVADRLGLPDLHFNVTHADGLVALAVSGLPEIGIDVEHLGRSMRSLDELAERHFGPAERARIGRVADEESRTQAFFDVWTLKEAYIKARGLGLSMALESFDLQWPPHDTDGRSVQLLCTAACGDDGARWQFHRARPTPHHSLAVAGASRANQRFQVVTRWVEALQAGRPVLEGPFPGMGIAG
ncbi:MAG: 4'-phosphopantetheinyl transferase superfamily protein [Rubrivivax sp.]|nr:MAG: 4'-phosphopantetheinyl transferase superfamily protein [Rubrivivax sp.]